MYNVLKFIHQIKTSDDEFKKYIIKHSPFFDNFKMYAEFLSEKNGKVKKRSNKAGSYKIALTRRAMAYELFFKEKLVDFRSMDTYRKLKSMDEHEGFKKFNREKKNFYSAALTAYLAYLTFLNEKIEEEYNLNDKQILIKEENPEYVIEKKKKLIRSFNRSISVINTAKIRDKYTCQYNKQHSTFITTQNTKYIEVHHMIPLSAQGMFNTKLDILENVICLCPNCHAEIHFSAFDNRERMVNQLYKRKIEDLKKVNIDINQKELNSLYQIVK